MKIILAPDSFKGTFTSMEVIKYLEEAARQHFSPLEVIRVPIADGGEGTVDAFIAATGGEYKSVQVMGPLEEMQVEAKYGVLHIQ
jgi:glycerate kinase